jgi:hypothetical protein
LSAFSSRPRARLNSLDGYALIARLIREVYERAPRLDVDDLAAGGRYSGATYLGRAISGILWGSRASGRSSLVGSRSHARRRGVMCYQFIPYAFAIATAAYEYKTTNHQAKAQNKAIEHDYRLLQQVQYQQQAEIIFLRPQIQPSGEVLA